MGDVSMLTKDIESVYLCTYTRSKVFCNSMMVLSYFITNQTKLLTDGNHSRVKKFKLVAAKNEFKRQSALKLNGLDIISQLKFNLFCTFLKLHKTALQLHDMTRF